jgi:hypothetical protein
MTDQATPPEHASGATEPGGLDWVAGVGSDWWATILGLAVAALAVANVLPRIPW